METRKQETKTKHKKQKQNSLQSAKSDRSENRIAWDRSEEAIEG